MSKEIKPPSQGPQGPQGSGDFLKVLHPEGKFRQIKETVSQVLKAKPELLDRYTPKILNQVMKGLKSLVTLRPDRASALAAKKEMAGQKAPAKEGVLVIRDGKAVTVEGQERASIDRSGLGPAGQAEQAVTSSVTQMGVSGGERLSPPDLKDDLSLFEKIFVARFEDGAELGERLPAGQFKFLGKTEKQWEQFFQSFRAFSVEKKAKVAELELLVYRGLLREARADAPRGVLVSDLKFATGKTDKFARLEVQGSEILQRLAEMMPGDVLAQALIAEWPFGIVGPEFAYQALSHRIVNPEAARENPNAATESYRSPEKAKEKAIREGTRETTPGIALSARTEQLMAERLDIDLRSSRTEINLDRGPAPNKIGDKVGDKIGDRVWEKQGTMDFGRSGSSGGIFGKRKRKGFFASLFSGEEGPSPDGTVFVPWYQHIFRRKRFPGKVRWWVPLTYFVSFSAAALFAFYVFKFLLQK